MEVLKLLIAKGAHINPPDCGPMTKAAIQGQNAIVKFLLASGASVNSVDKNGRSALSHATEKRNLNLVMTLLEAKADPNAGTLNLPLSWAIKQGDTNLVGVLLRAGADPNKTADSVRPLELAVGGMQPAIVQLLLQFKADPNVSFGTGTLPIFRGLFDLEILKALLAAGANPNSIETNSSGGIGAQGETPLQVAARIRFERSADGQRYTLNNRGDFDAARLLIAHGAKVNVQRPSDGMTPLHLAVRAVNRELVELLLTNKAEVNVRSSAGSTPLDLAKSQATQTSLDTSSRATSAEIVALLRRHGALDALPDFSKIRVTRQSLNQPITVFEQNTNGGNRYTVLEALLDLYLKAHDSSVLNGPVTVSKTWAFPDLTRLIIYRRARTGADKEQLIPLNLLNPTNGIICGRDVILEFGDILEIPTREYTLGEPSIGLTSEQENAIADCLERSVTLKVRGQTRELQLKPHIVKFTGSLFCFYLQSALNTPEAQSLLLSSSDLARVKVIRKDAENGRTVEFIVNAALNSSDLLFWLRDGDVIEVPEK
jgi:ankyrin repeat protein